MIRDVDERLLATLCNMAAKGYICPPLKRLGDMLGVSEKAVFSAFESLKNGGRVSWRFRTIGRARRTRIVTILETGAQTAVPKTERVYHEYTPTNSGCRVRRLEGEEFRRRCAEIIARDGATWKPVCGERWGDTT